MEERRRPAGSVVAAFAALLGLVLVVGVVGVLAAFQGWNRRLELRREALEAHTQVAELEGAYALEENALLTFAASGGPTDLDTFHQAVDHTDALLAKARGVLVEGQNRAALEDVAADAVAWREAAETAAVARRQVPPPAQLRTHLSILVDRVGTSAAERVASAADAGRRATMAFWLTFSLVALLSVAGTVAVRSWITNPMRRLRDAVTDGEHNKPITTDGPAELRAIGDAVERMRVNLLAQRDRATRAREALEQNATLTVKISAELGSAVGLMPDGWTAAAGLWPAAGMVAGDAYAVKLLRADEIGVVLLDTVGHGAGPSILALRCREVILAGLRLGQEPGAALEGLKHHDHGLTQGDFLSAFVATVDTSSGLCRYANAGHPAALMTSPSGPRLLGCTGPVFGPFPERTWETRSVALERGESLVVYSDGVIEARNTSGFYGVERLTASVGEEQAPADALLRRIQDDLVAFGGTVRRDDQSIVVVSHLDPNATNVPAHESDTSDGALTRSSTSPDDQPAGV